MKGKKEGGEIKGREGRKRGKGEKEREKKRKGEREREKKNRVPQQGSNPRSSTLQPTAYAYRLEGRFVRTIHVYIANFDFDDLTVAALAPPIIYPYICFINKMTLTLHISWLHVVFTRTQVSSRFHPLSIKLWEMTLI